ncbi:MAG: hypothetical protein IT368_13140 [Candidatus Hydrogenedentes bacterium]|nr:hypothetical protein [Candidatus Hydrogenedentota bacterium]
MIVGKYGGNPTGTGHPLIFEGGRSGWRQAELSGVSGSLLSTDGEMAVGLGPAGLWLTRAGDVTWLSWPTGLEPVGVLDPQVGLTDFASCVPGPRSPTCYACGFDGPTRGRDVLLGMSDTGWNRMDTPWGDADIGSLNAVAITPTGALLVGGQEVVRPAEGQPGVAKAMLKLRSGEGQWTEIVLPNAAALATVNDILVTAAGESFLACGSGAIHLVHMGPDAPATDEGPGTAGRVTTLAEGPGGTIWAVGEANGRALLLRRTP